MRFEFREGHLDRVEIRTVRRGEEEPCPSRFEDGLGLFAFVAGKIVEDHNVAGTEGGGELGFDIGLEGRAVHRTVDDPRRGQAITAQGGNEGLGFPVAEWRTRLEALVASCAPSQPCHLGRGRSLVNEDQPMRLFAQVGLAIHTPGPTGLTDILASAFRRQQRFF